MHSNAVLTVKKLELVAARHSKESHLQHLRRRRPAVDAAEGMIPAGPPSAAVALLATSSALALHRTYWQHASGGLSDAS